MRLQSLTARCAQVNGRPPLCHVILNVIVAFFFPIVSHFLARPDDHISLSFIGTIGAQLISYILGWLGKGDNLDSSLITSLGGLIYFVLVVYVILVCLLTEKKNPYQVQTAPVLAMSAPMGFLTGRVRASSVTGTGSSGVVDDLER